MEEKRELTDTEKEEQELKERLAAVEEKKREEKRRQKEEARLAARQKEQEEYAEALIRRIQSVGPELHNFVVVLNNKLDESIIWTPYTTDNKPDSRFAARINEAVKKYGALGYTAEVGDYRFYIYADPKRRDSYRRQYYIAGVVGLYVEHGYDKVIDWTAKSFGEPAVKKLFKGLRDNVHKARVDIERREKAKTDKEHIKEILGNHFVEVSVYRPRLHSGSTSRWADWCDADVKTADGSRFTLNFVKVDTEEGVVRAKRTIRTDFVATQYGVEESVPEGQMFTDSLKPAEV